MRKSLLKIVNKSRPTPVRRATETNAIKAPAADKGYIDPERLHGMLPISATKIITFASENSMNMYRRNLYKINQQGDYRYRTLRDEMSMWGLVIWRMK